MYKKINCYLWDIKLGRGKIICFCFILVCEDLQNCDEHIALIDMKKCSVWGMCVVVHLSPCLK